MCGVISQPRFERFRQNLVRWCSSTPLSVLTINKFQISKIQDGGNRNLEKSKNRHISAAVQPILTKFGTVTQFGPRDCLARYSDLKKSKMSAAGILTS